MKSFDEVQHEWSSLHGGVEARGIVKRWLTIAYRVAKLLNKLRINASHVTFVGVLLAALVALSSPKWWSALFLALSLLCDGIDGTLAIINEKTSALGATYDAAADRLSEALWALAFYRLGAPANWVICFWTIASVQEYARARLAAEGIVEVGVITPGERPVRASFLCIAIVAWQILIFHGWISPILIVLTALQVISLSMVISFARKKLK
jgi:CDP-diacylglycerol--glycerol-3-phosphate 3-phosphatidyltransferase